MTERYRPFSTAVFTLLSIVCCAVACAPETVDLVIGDAAVLDVRTGAVRRGLTVVIDTGHIVRLQDGSRRRPDARDTVAAAGRLLVPGLIDVHHHIDYILGDSVGAGGGMVTHLSMQPDSIAAYRRVFADSYLPYGVTTVRDVGSTERDIALLLAWTQRSPEAPDFYPTGGALVSHEPGRTPYPGHAVVRDSADAARHVRGLFDQGIRHVKLYWRLREPELRAALAEALRLGMNVTSHIDYQVVPLDATIDLGLRSFEHAYTVGVGAMSNDEFVDVWRRTRRLLEGREEGLYYVGVMEYFNHLGSDHPAVLAIIDRLAATGSTVTPTLHVFAQRFGLTYFTTPSLAAFDRTQDLPERQRERAVAGYRVLAGYVKRMHERGVRLTVGTDWADPGRAVLSEMLLLHALGIPMAEVLRIATLNGAEAIGVADEVGSVEVGKRASLLLFDLSPLDDPSHLLGRKLVIKDGRVWARDGRGPGGSPVSPGG